ncbi:hypothetical protein Dsin_009297 [Dipteronia sinensis]|uniref:DUF4283 domain-containing protein n=1 Tax=Dipteronia sinensis TaxID=43782 RepID=A0AAE0AQP8_9ROSI|nr:hypothetical protein Dsin_009297 [Dipteronia sinensis]
MTLKDREGPVRKLKDDLKVAGIQMLSSSLVGKILTNQQVNREAFMGVMKKIWRVKERLDIETVSHNIFVFHFKDPGDKLSVFAGGPWSFDNALIVFEEPEGRGDIQGMQFRQADFWVQIHNVPMLCMAAEIGRFLGSVIGEVKEIDGGESGVCMGHATRECPDDSAKSEVADNCGMAFGYRLKAASSGGGNNPGISQSNLIRDGDSESAPINGKVAEQQIQTDMASRSKGKVILTSNGNLGLGINEMNPPDIVSPSNKNLHDLVGFIFTSQKQSTPSSLAKKSEDGATKKQALVIDEQPNMGLNMGPIHCNQDSLNLGSLENQKGPKKQIVLADEGIGPTTTNYEIKESEADTSNNNSRLSQGSGGKWKRCARRVMVESDSIENESRLGKRLNIEFFDCGDRISKKAKIGGRSDDSNEFLSAGYFSLSYSMEINWVLRSSGASQRHHGLNLLRRLHGLSDLPWLCTGDFNEIICDSEKASGIQRSRAQMEAFREVINDCDLDDLGYSGPAFTWCNKRGDGEMVQERLDRGLCNYQWKEIFKDTTVSHLEFWKSDHRPILIDINPMNNQCAPVVGNRRRFHFEESLADSKDCVALIGSLWGKGGSASDMHGVVGDIKKCYVQLGRWNSRCGKELRRNILSKQQELKVASYHI